MLEHSGRIAVVGEAAGGIEAVSITDVLRPGVVLMDGCCIAAWPIHRQPSRIPNGPSRSFASRNPQHR